MATNTSAISLNKVLDRRAREGARVNLRMWSDTTSFRDAAQRIALTPEIIADKGEPRRDRKGAPLTSRFPRNYVSLEESKVDNGSELQPCVINILDAVSASGYASLTKVKNVEGTLWIAVFSGDFAYQDAIEASTIARASDLGVSLFIEDYSRLDGDGVPIKIWLND
jgi:hypothetical protein